MMTTQEGESCVIFERSHLHAGWAFQHVKDQGGSFAIYCYVDVVL